MKGEKAGHAAISPTASDKRMEGIVSGKVQHMPCLNSGLFLEGLVCVEGMLFLENCY